MKHQTVRNSTEWMGDGAYNSMLIEGGSSPSRERRAAALSSPASAIVVQSGDTLSE